MLFYDRLRTYRAFQYVETQMGNLADAINQGNSWLYMHVAAMTLYTYFAFIWADFFWVVRFFGWV